AGSAPAVWASLLSAACGSQPATSPAGLLPKSGMWLSSVQIHSVRAITRGDRNDGLVDEGHRHRENHRGQDQAIRPGAGPGTSDGVHCFSPRSVPGRQEATSASVRALMPAARVTVESREVTLASGNVARIPGIPHPNPRITHPLREALP